MTFGDNKIWTIDVNDFICKEKLIEDTSWRGNLFCAIISEENLTASSSDCARLRSNSWIQKKLIYVMALDQSQIF